MKNGQLSNTVEPVRRERGTTTAALKIPRRSRRQSKPGSVPHLLEQEAKDGHIWLCVLFRERTFIKAELARR